MCLHFYSKYLHNDKKFYALLLYFLREWVNIQIDFQVVHQVDRVRLPLHPPHVPPVEEDLIMVKWCLLSQHEIMNLRKSPHNLDMAHCQVSFSLINCLCLVIQTFSFPRYFLLFFNFNQMFLFFNAWFLVRFVFGGNFWVNCPR